MLVDLSQEITPFWKPLGVKLKVPIVELQAIQYDNIHFPAVTDKAFRMLSAWIDQGQATFHDLSENYGQLADGPTCRRQLKVFTT